FCKDKSKLNNHIQFMIKQIILFAFKRKRKQKIITLVRDPLSRNISSYFHQMGEQKEVNLKGLSFEQLVENFEKKMNHDAPLVWFDLEIQKYFNIDVYKYKFDKKQGYTIISEGNVEILIIQMEKMND